MIENTLKVTSETEKKIVAPKTNIMPEVPSPSKKSVLSKALAYAYSFYKDKDTLTTLSEPPTNTNTIAPTSIITPALLQSIWVDFDSSDSETDEPKNTHNSNPRIEVCDYGYTKYDSSTDEAESEDDGYHSYGTTYDSATYANWRNLKR